MQDKLLRDLLGSPIPQYFNEDLQIFAVKTTDGSVVTNVDFSQTKLLRDRLGSVIPQLWDVKNGVWVVDTGQILKMDKIKADNKSMVLEGAREGWYKPYGAGIDQNEIHTMYTAKGITAISDGSLTAIRNNNIRPFSLLNRMYATAFVYVENAKNIGSLLFYFANSSSYEAYKAYEFNANSLTEGWNELIIDLTKPFEVEGVSDNIIRSIQVATSSINNEVGKVTFDSLFVSDRDRKAKVIFTFDDGWLSQYTTAFPLMLERGMRGCIGVISQATDNNFFDESENIMNIEQLKEVYRHGWDLFNHTHTHPRLATLSAENAVNEIVTCKNWLDGHGFTRASDILAYPYGSYTTEIADALRPHLKYARSLVEGFEPSFPLDNMQGKTKNVLNLSAETIKGFVDEAINTKSTLVLCLHKIGDVEDEYGTTLFTSTFISILDYLEEQKEYIDVVTLSEWVSAFQE